MLTTRARPTNSTPKCQALHSDQEFEISHSSDSDFIEDVSRKVSSRHGARKRKRRIQKDTDSEDEDHNDSKAPATSPSSAPLPRHPTSTHTIKDVEAVRIALLEWYAGVHEKRGMPWRKMYDASLSREGRAQRAYEVGFVLRSCSRVW